MVTRVCISINNECDLHCAYCHFREKRASIRAAEMPVLPILSNIKAYIAAHGIERFKIGFVGNGEPLLAFGRLKEYIAFLDGEIASGKISVYTITNGLSADEEKLRFFKEHGVRVGFSLDGPKFIHDRLRCNTFDAVMEAVERYRLIFGEYPSFNCTAGREVLDHADEVISFFVPFGSRVTFSRMIGRMAVGEAEFRAFLGRAKERLDVRTGGYDCTTYGGKCGAGIDNYFYANGYIYLCGNCIDLPLRFPASTPLDEVKFGLPDFDREHCYKETSR